MKNYQNEKMTHNSMNIDHNLKKAINGPEMKNEKRFNWENISKQQQTTTKDV